MSVVCRMDNGMYVKGPRGECSDCRWGKSTRQERAASKLDLAARTLQGAPCDPFSHFDVGDTKFICHRCKALEVITDLHGEFAAKDSAK